MAVWDTYKSKVCRSIVKSGATDTWIRGSTPDFSFYLFTGDGDPVKASELTKANVAFEQNGQIVLEKHLGEATLFEDEPNRISFHLSESETLLFSDKDPLFFQFRGGINSTRINSNVIRKDIARIIKDGALL